jgi:ribosomal protein S18 acetylase RimI-like enzyme
MNEMKLVLRYAEDRDLPELWRLHRQALGRYYIYTVYQSPASVRYLLEITRRTVAGQQLIVAEADGRLAGFYLGIENKSTFLLNYIGVDSVYRGHRVGSALLEDFEVRGRVSGRKRFMLDVFENNLNVIAWYRRRGYEEESRRYLAHMRLRGEGARGVWEVDPTQLELALKMEATRGFAAVRVIGSAGYVSVGLIAGDTCKILDKGGVSLADALLVVRDQFSYRKHVICISDNEKELPEQPDSRHCSIRMQRVALDQ